MCVSMVINNFFLKFIVPFLCNGMECITFGFDSIDFDGHTSEFGYYFLVLILKDALALLRVFG